MEDMKDGEYINIIKTHLLDCCFLKSKYSYQKTQIEQETMKQLIKKLSIACIDFSTSINNPGPDDAVLKYYCNIALDTMISIMQEYLPDYQIQFDRDTAVFKDYHNIFVLLDALYKDIRRTPVDKLMQFLNINPQTHTNNKQLKNTFALLFTLVNSNNIFFISHLHVDIVISLVDMPLTPDDIIYLKYHTRHNLLFIIETLYYFGIDIMNVNLFDIGTSIGEIFTLADRIILDDEISDHIKLYNIFHSIMINFSDRDITNSF